MPGFECRLGFNAFLCLIGVLVGAAGCTPDSDPGQLYLQRLAGTLDQSYEIRESSLPAFPLGETLRIERATTRLAIVDVLEVHRCDLGALVAGRNGGLGRVQTASQRYLYDRALVRGLGACDAPGDALQAILQQRRAELPISLFNALFSGDEWHDFVTPGVVPPATSVDSGQLTRVLSRLLTMARQPVVQPLVAAEFEGLLAQLRFSRALGEQRRRWREQAQVLVTATQMLTQAKITNPGCRTGTPTEAGRHRLNVFQTFYVEGVQEGLAREAQPDRGWLKLLQELLDTLIQPVIHEPAAQQVAAWHERVLGSSTDQEYGRWQMALAEHTRAWQWQLRACGLLPGNRTGNRTRS